MPAPSTDALAPLALQGQAPIYRQLYERVRAAIAAGTLHPGARIPSARALAKELGVARGTIEVAYELQAAEGYLLARGQAGTVVNPALQPSVGAPHASAPASQVNALPGAATAAVDASPARRATRCGDRLSCYRFRWGCRRWRRYPRPGGCRRTNGNNSCTPAPAR